MILIYSKSVDGFVSKVICYLLNFNVVKIGLLDGLKIDTVSLDKKHTFSIHNLFICISVIAHNFVYLFDI